MEESSVKKQTALSEMEGLIREKLAAGGSVTFSPKGTSMLPMLRASGDSVTLVKPPARIKKGTVALFISHNEEGERSFILHRLVGKDGGKLVFLGDNRRFCDVPVEYEDVIGVVSEYESRGKKHSCRGLWYGIYTFWMLITRRLRLPAAKLQGFFYRVWKRLKG